MLARRGLYNAREVLQEVAREVVEFAVVAGVDRVGPHGIDLRLNQIADGQAATATTATV